jgi:hypothetical protein
MLVKDDGSRNISVFVSDHGGGYDGENVICRHVNGTEEMVVRFLLDYLGFDCVARLTCAEVLEMHSMGQPSWIDFIYF